jgi:hypothetical protein
MNLVQINERLKDLPMQVLQQYANGMNPEVPPYLALGELQRREMSQKQMATAQGAQQGPQPSVKEQVEQKAGLMALQQMQQQQMAQQMQQPRGPMPVPAGAPQPEPQPEAMMARGGLAGIPVRRDMFEYAGGGIIAFQSGGQSLNERAARQMKEKGSIYDPYFGVPEEERRRLKEEDDLKKAQSFASGSLSLIQSNAQAMADSAQSRVTELEQNREELTRKFGPRMYEQALSKAQQAVEAATARGSELVDRQTQTGQARIAAATPPPFGSRFAPANPADMMGSPAGLPAALAKAAPAVAGGTQTPAAAKPAATRPATTPPATPPAQASAQPNVSPFLAEAATMAREKPVAPTAEGVIKDVNALMPAGLQEAAQQKLFADQRARADERKAAFEKSKPSGLDDLIRVFGQAGQYKGLSGMGPAYTANQERKRAEELGFQKEQDALLTAIEGRSTAADKGVFDARTGAMDKANKAFQDRLMTNTKALADLAGVDQSRIDNVLRNLNQMQVAKLQAATAARPSEAERIEAKYMGMIAKGQTKEAEEYLNTIAKIKGGGAAGVGAGRNAILERRQEMKELESMAKNESGQFSEADSKWAASRIAQLARENAKESGGKESAGVPLPENASAKNLVVGTVYQTAKGPAKWTGTGFMPI